MAARRDTESQAKAKIDAGQWVFNFGVHFTYRTQKNDAVDDRFNGQIANVETWNQALNHNEVVSLSGVDDHVPAPVRRARPLKLRAHSLVRWLHIYTSMISLLMDVSRRHTTSAAARRA